MQITNTMKKYPEMHNLRGSSSSVECLLYKPGKKKQEDTTALYHCAPFQPAEYKSTVIVLILCQMNNDEVHGSLVRNGDKYLNKC